MANLRAVPWPLAAGISAARHAAVLATSAANGAAIGGFVSAAITGGVSWANMADMSLSGGGGSMAISQQRPWSLGLSLMWRSAPSRPAISSAMKRPGERPSTRRITSPTAAAARRRPTRSGPPPRLHGREQRDELVPIGEVVDGDCSRKPQSPARWLNR